MNTNQRWYLRQQLFNQTIPPALLPWLFDVSSLTARLLDLCGNEFRVKVLSQQWRVLTAEEARVMSLNSVRTALIRQVLLCCGEKPLVYARTVIPATTITGAQRCYANMGSRPLGAMLFADRTMQREAVQVAALPASHAAYQYVSDDQTVWGRRSVFRVSGKPLLVSEFFLPALIDGV